MKKIKIKYLLIGMLTSMLLLPNPIRAESSKGPILPTYEWRINNIQKNVYTSSNNHDYVFLYESLPVVRDGETVSVSATKGYSHTYSGSMSYTIKKAVQAQLGYSYGTNVSFSVSKTTPPLKKGDYIRAYWRKNYSVSAVYLDYIKYNPYTNEETVEKTSHVVSLEAISPQLKLEYYSNNSRGFNISSLEKSKNDEPIRIEYYSPNESGQYELIKVVNN